MSPDTNTVTAYAAMSATEPLTKTTITRRGVGAHDVRFDIHFAGICHSDIHTVRAEWGQPRYPVTSAAVPRDLVSVAPGLVAAIGLRHCPAISVAKAGQSVAAAAPDVPVSAAPGPVSATATPSGTAATTGSVTTPSMLVVGTVAPGAIRAGEARARGRTRGITAGSIRITAAGTTAAGTEAGGAAGGLRSPSARPPGACSPRPPAGGSVTVPSTLTPTTRPCPPPS